MSFRAQQTNEGAFAICLKYMKATILGTSSHSLHYLHYETHHIINIHVFNFQALYMRAYHALLPLDELSQVILDARFLLFRGKTRLPHAIILYGASTKK